MKLGLLAAALVLVAGGAVGCGGSDDGGDSGADAPTTKDFCGALKDFQTQYATADPTKDLKAYIKTTKDAAAQLANIGTPDGMPSDAKAGFDLTVSKIKALPDDATVDDLAHIGDVDEADQKNLDAFDDYVTKTCPELGDQTGSQEPAG
jgi:hypothetical protein